MPKLKDYGFVFPFGKPITYQTKKKYLAIRKDKGRVQNTKTENHPLFEDRSLKKKNIGASIRIGQEIWCVPFAGFSLILFHIFSLSSNLHLSLVFL